MLKNLLLFAFLLILVFPASLFSQDRDELDYRPVRVTLVPGLSTNGLEAPNYTAKYSLNILVGYHGGLNGYELGLVNINRRYASGMQAGLLNITGGEQNGIQLSSFGNLTYRNANGIHISGLANITGGMASGFQLGGAVNMSRESMQGITISGLTNASQGSLRGLQFTGGANYAGGNAQGMQFAGIGNISLGNMQGMQVAGLFNAGTLNMEGIAISGVTNVTTGPSSGMMITGGVNISRDASGILLAGIMNTGRSLSGIQLAGTANISDRAEGIQIGLINIAREFEGVPIGVLSIYGNGRKNIDTWTNETGFTHVGLKFGTTEVYNMISVGYNTFIDDRDIWSLGWSIGYYRTLDEAWDRPNLDDYFSIHDFTYQNIQDGEWSAKLNNQISYRYLLGKQISDQFSIYAGPTLNLLISREENNDDYTLYNITSSNRSGVDYRFWAGITAGVQLFKH